MSQEEKTPDSDMEKQMLEIRALIEDIQEKHGEVLEYVHQSAQELAESLQGFESRVEDSLSKILEESESKETVVDVRDDVDLAIEESSLLKSMGEQLDSIEEKIEELQEVYEKEDEEEDDDE